MWIPQSLLVHRTSPKYGKWVNKNDNYGSEIVLARFDMKQKVSLQNKIKWFFESVFVSCFDTSPKMQQQSCCPSQDLLFDILQPYIG